MRETPDAPPPPAWAQPQGMPHQADAPAGVRLEPELWDALADICRQQDVALDALLRRISAADAAPGRTNGAPGLTSAVRVFIVAYYRQASRTADPIGRSLQIVSGSSRTS